MRGSGAKRALNVHGGPEVSASGSLALKGTPRAASAWELLPPSGKREHVKSVLGARRASSVRWMRSELVWLRISRPTAGDTNELSNAPPPRLTSHSLAIVDGSRRRV